MALLKLRFSGMKRNCKFHVIKKLYFDQVEISFVY